MISRCLSHPAVQAEGCAPIVKAYRDGVENAAMFPNAHTIASGLRVPAAVGDFLMLRILRESHGTGVTVTDDELMQGVGEIASQQGIYACPEGGAVWAAAKQLTASGWLKPDERIVLFNTGTGLKYNHLLVVHDLPWLDHTSANAIDEIAKRVR